MLEILVKLKRKSHPDGLSSQRPTPSTMACAELVQTQNQKTGQNRDIWPFVSLGENIAGRRSPFLSTKEIRVRG